MPSCAFDKCRNHSRKKNKTHGITFHAFPQDELWGHKWLRVVRRQRQEPDWTPTNHSRVCSLHFQPEDMYTTGKGMKRIKNGAVPSYKSPYKTTQHNSSDSEQSSASDSVEESPPNKFLIRKIEKVLAEKKRLFQVNVNLKKRNKRLVGKCKSFKEIIVGLKDRISVLESRIREIETG